MILKKVNPLSLILGWLVLAIVFSVIYMIFLGVSTPGGEQRPFTFLGKAIPIIIYGILIIAITSIPIYIEWIKKFWYINLFFIAACVIFIIKDRIEENKDPYFTSTKIIMLNGKDYEQTIQYYNSKSTIIRSISFHLNGKKDSTWTVFAEDGKIISQEKYKNGKYINVQFNVVIDSIQSSNVNPTKNNDSSFYEERIFDTVGKKYSEDLTALLDILSHYKIKIPAFKYSYILKLHINAGGMYDNFILSNDKMPVFRASFNRNITPTQVIYYKFKNSEIDSSIYEFLGIGKLNKL
ncbi:MAG: hypothetical protein ABIY35_04555 [Chitinophagaceae bacterium]